MTGVSTSFVRPANLDALQANLVELAVGGAVSPDSEVRGWLEAMSVSRSTSEGLAVADEDWLACSLPAESADELLSRSLLRDPLYRLHVDLLLAEVVTEIGLSNRWSRLEDLVFGELAVLAPRLVALVNFLRQVDGDLENESWRGLDVFPPNTAVRFDERCWGMSGNAESMFPVLRTRYPAFASVPVFFQATTPIVSTIVAAASSGEAVRIAPGLQEELANLARQGLPLWPLALTDGTFEVTLSGPVRVRSEQDDDLPTQPFSRGIPTGVQAASAVLPTHRCLARADFWTIADTGGPGQAFVGTTKRDAWPSDDEALRRGLPRSEDLINLVRARRLENSMRDSADAALRSLAEHPLFGFWLQILLLEALDRELGEETLLFAPPTHVIVGDVEAATRVYYRPRSESSRQLQALLELGALDDVMTRVATGVGVHPVAVLGDAAGPWSMSLALLATVGITQTRHDRWTLSTHALDRLHGGGLMTGVIRRGREFREHLHVVLEDLWRVCADPVQEARGA